MGQPISWDYSITVAPIEDATTVTLHRIQRGSGTRFLWGTATLTEGLEHATEDGVLQLLYTGILQLMEQTA